MNSSNIKLARKKDINYDVLWVTIGIILLYAKKIIDGYIEDSPKIRDQIFDFIFKGVSSMIW